MVQSQALRCLLTCALLACASPAWAINVSGGITTDTTWSLADSPVVLTGDTVVQAGATLTIDPGVEVKASDADSGDVELIVRGALVAAGTEANPIVFRSDSATAPGSWEGLVVEAGGALNLRHAEILHADYGVELQTPAPADITISDVSLSIYRSRGFLISGGSVTLTDVVLDGSDADTGAYGVYASSTGLTIDGADVHDHATGLYIENSQLTIERAAIWNNTTDGIRNRRTTTGNSTMTVNRCTFYNNADAIEVYRTSSSSRTLSFTIDESIFGENNYVVRDTGSSSYRSTFSRWRRNVSWNNATFTNGYSPSSNTENLSYNALFVDPANGDFEPTDRSPARYFSPTDPAGTLGAIPYAGASTGAGVHGFWYVDTTFDPLEVVDVAGDVIVAPGVTMTFLPGSEFRMATTDIMAGGLSASKVEVRVEGTLEADGTLSRPVQFTSAAASPGAGDWYGLVIVPETEAFNIAQVEIEYAERGVSLYGNDHIVAGSRISECSSAGIYIEGGTPQIEQVDIFDSQRGIWVAGATSVSLNDVDVYDNTTEGLYAENATVSWTTGRIYDNGSDGIRSRRTTTGNTVLTFDGLTVANNSGDGVEVYRTSSSSRTQTMTLRDSSVTHNGGSGLRDTGSSSYRTSVRCEQSNVWGNSGLFTNISFSLNTCVSWNPLYADLDTRDYRPTQYSPNRGLGTGGGIIGALPYDGALGPQIMGFLWDDLTFTEAGSPYTILGDLYIPASTNVTFESGAELRFSLSDGMQGGQASSETELRFLEGSVANFPDSGEYALFRPDTDSPSPGDWWGIGVDNGSGLAFDHIRVMYPEYGMNIVGPGAPTITDSEFIYHDSAGISASSVTSSPGVDILATAIVGDGNGTGVAAMNGNVRVRSSYITHHGDGIDVQVTQTGTYYLRAINNTIIRHTTGIEYYRSSSSSRQLQTDIHNNVIAYNSSNAIRDRSSSSYRATSRVTYNNFYERSTTSNISGTVTNNITSDPLVEDDDWDLFPRWWDGKLWRESLSINAGSASVTNIPDRDFRGIPRNTAGGVDMGAWEFDPDANEEPRADAVTDSIMVPRGESFSLDGSAAFDPDGTIASAFWTMSDGTVTAGQSVTHTFATEGPQWAYITIIDDDGAEDHAKVDVNVNVRPIADAGPAVFQDEGPDESVFFDGTLSTDPDGSVVAWEWDFGDGSPTSSEQSPRHSYLSAGVFTVTLTVTDNEGLTDSDTTTATVFGTTDTVGPLITHTEISDGQPLGSDVTVNATIQDPSDVTSAVLSYRRAGTSVPAFVVMTNTSGNNWQAVIPGSAVQAPGVEYWFTAQDGVTPSANTSTAPAGAPGGGVYDFLVVGDPDPPAISHTEIADGQTDGAPVTVTATVTDDTGVGTVNLYFRPMSGSSFGAAPMTNTGGDTWEGTIPGFVVASPGVEYYIEATDTSPIPNTGVAPSGAPGTLYDFVVGSGDTSGPLIAHTPIPDGQRIGADISVSAGIADSGGVASAMVYYRAAGAPSFSMASMTRGTGSNWAGAIPGAAVVLPGMEYYIQAEDDAGNTSTDPEGGAGAPYTFSTSDADTVGPVITHTPVPNGQAEGEDVTITAEVSDTSEITSVRLRYRPELFPIYSDLDLTNTGGDTYSGAIPGFSVSSPAVVYYIQATDSEGNTTLFPETAPGTPVTFTVGSSDEAPPTIVVDEVLDGREAGVAVTVSAVIFDDSDIDSATLHYRSVGAPSFTTTAMTNPDGSNWEATIPAGDVAEGAIEYYVSAIDASTNANEATAPADAPGDTYMFTVIVPDVSAPVITHTPIAELIYGDNLRITATVTDDVGVASASVYWANDDGAYTPQPMIPGADDGYSTTIASDLIADGTVVVRYYIEANDGAGNTATSPASGAGGPNEVTITYPDMTPPDVTLGALPPTITIGADIDVSATATDASGITEVTFFYRSTTGGAWNSLTGTSTGSDDWAATIPGAAVLEPGVEIYAEAVDGAGNAASTESSSVVVEPAPDLTAPVIELAEVADGQAEGADVRVSAQIADESGIESATLYYRVSGATPFDSVTMTNESGEEWYATIPGGDVVTPGVEYYVEATDSSSASNAAIAPDGAPGTPASFTVTATDSAGPTISHASPALPILDGSMVAIDATVTDSSGVASVTVYWRTEGETDFNMVDMVGDGESFSGEIGPVSAPGFEYYIEATDSLDNVSTDPTGAPGMTRSRPVIVPDATAPEIVHAPAPGTRTPGVAEAIEATITDTSGIASASVFYRTIGEPTFRELAMSSDGDTYTAVLSGGAVNEPGVEYYITATDGADPSNAANAPADAPTTVFAFVVGDGPEDRDAPVIDHTPIVEGSEGVALTVTASVTDASGLESVTLLYRTAGTVLWSNTPMSGDGDTYSADVPAETVASPGVEYYLVAVDGSDRANTATSPSGAPLATHTVIVDEGDSAGPTIVLEEVASPQAAGTPVAVVAEVIDPAGVDVVSLNFRHIDDEWDFVDMTLDSGDSYTGTIPVESVREGVVEFYVEASDLLGNVASVPSEGADDPETFDVEAPVEEDTTGPTILHSPVTVTENGDGVSISAIVTDASGVSEVLVRFREGGEESWVDAELVADGDRFEGSIPGFATRGDTVEYYIEAADGSALENVSVDPEGAPDAFHVIDVLGGSSEDVGTDAGGGEDAGGSEDAGTDAGESDAGTDDTGVEADTGAEVDSGSSTQDATSDGSASQDDASGGASGSGKGGGCSAAGGAAGAWWLALGLIVLRRRRR